MPQNRVRLNQLHKYLYANVDPINGRDPSGHFDLVGLLSTVALGAGLIALGTYGVVNIYHAIGEIRPSSAGQGGKDITNQLLHLRASFIADWDREPDSVRDSMFSNAISFGSPRSALGAWDIYQLGPHRVDTPTMFQTPGAASPIPYTVTVAGKVYWEDDVNYYLFGLMLRLYAEDRDGIVNHNLPSSDDTLMYGLQVVSIYRRSLYLGTHTESRRDWTVAGYYGDFSAAADAALPATATPGPRDTTDTLTGFLDGPTPITGVGMP